MSDAACLFDLNTLPVFVPFNFFFFLDVVDKIFLQLLGVNIRCKINAGFTLPGIKVGYYDIFMKMLL